MCKLHSKFVINKMSFYNLMLEHNTTKTMQTQLFSNEQHAFEKNANTNFLNPQNSLYITEIDYTLLTAKQIDPKFGLMQVQVPRKRVVQCDQCHSEMQVEEGTVIPEFPNSPVSIFVIIFIILIVVTIIQKKQMRTISDRKSVV